MKNETIILGDEYDLDLRNRVISSITAKGGKSLSNNWVTAGSQEIIDEEFEIEGCVIKLEAETYVGLSISGPNNILQAIKSSI